MRAQLSAGRSLKLPGKKFKVAFRTLEREHIYTILTDISDHVKNSLTVIKGLAQFIRAKNGGLYHEYFEIIDSEIDKIIITVDGYRNRYRHK